VDYQFSKILEALRLLDGRLVLNQAGPFRLVVRGGAALNATHLIQRTTNDVDVVALIGPKGELADPAPLPEELVNAAKEVTDTLALPEEWLNNGPSRGDGGLFRLGLPAEFKNRLVAGYQGEKLTVYFVGRLDQIHFKLYAAIDQFGGYHASDLKQLLPTDEELLQAVAWAKTHDRSEGFKEAAKLFLREFGCERLVDKI